MRCSKRSASRVPEILYGGHSEVVITLVCGTGIMGSIPIGRPKAPVAQLDRALRFGRKGLQVRPLPGVPSGLVAQLVDLPRKYWAASSIGRAAPS